MKISVNKDGVLRLPERYREQWGLEAGTELLLERIEDGFALWRSNPTPDELTSRSQPLAI
jgi:bifunctional DNA-binding transcriptional regulator/antitoxin component of YhaV-PrlF toxin-antitoxin module